MISTQPLLNIQKLIKFTGMSNPDDLFVLLYAFRKDFTDLVTGLEEAIQTFNYPKMKQLAHGLKGVAASISVDTLSESSKQLESSAHSEYRNECQFQFNLLYLQTLKLLHIIHEYFIEHDFHTKVEYVTHTFLIIDADKGSQILTRKMLEQNQFTVLDTVFSIQQAEPVIQDSFISGAGILLNDSITIEDQLQFMKNVRTGLYGIDRECPIFLLVKDVKTINWYGYVDLDVNGILQKPCKREQFLNTVMELDGLNSKPYSWLCSAKEYNGTSIDLFQPLENKNRNSTHVEWKDLLKQETIPNEIFSQYDMLLCKHETKITPNRIRLFHSLSNYGISFVRSNHEC